MTPSFISCAAERSAVEQWSEPEIGGCSLLLRAYMTVNETVAQTRPVPMATTRPCQTLTKKMTHAAAYDIRLNLRRASMRFSQMKPHLRGRRAAAVGQGRSAAKGRPRAGDSISGAGEVRRPSTRHARGEDEQPREHEARQEEEDLTRTASARGQRRPSKAVQGRGGRGGCISHLDWREEDETAEAAHGVRGRRLAQRVHDRIVDLATRAQACARRQKEAAWRLERCVEVRVRRPEGDGWQESGAQQWRKCSTWVNFVCE